MQTGVTCFRDYSYPNRPGVYIMRDQQDKIIYIGKAKNLNKRIKSYFVKNNPSVEKENWKTSILISKIFKIDYIITDNEIEAFLLESNLIKRYRPVFNIELKDQQRYTYLKITDEKFPRLQVARRNTNGEFSGGKGEIIGPFVKGSSRYLSIGLLRKTFKIRICNRLPKKECLEYHIGNCDAPCINRVTEQEYMKNIESLKNILINNNTLNDFYQKLEDEMRLASEHQDYETAIQIRDTLHRLKNLRLNQKMENTPIKFGIEDYIGIIEDRIQKIVHVMMMMSKNGVINDMKKYEFDIIGDNTIENFISQYYYSCPTVPQVIYINKKIRDKGKLLEVLKRVTGYNIKISTVSNLVEYTPTNIQRNEIIIEKNNSALKDDKIEIMNLILKNLSINIQKQYEPALDELKKTLKLSKVPHIIDCFDISNFGNEFATGACTRFVNGIPHKSGYRKFKIKGVMQQNDFEMMEEIIKRRYTNEKDIKDQNKHTSEKYPDLIVIDGGRGHLNAALKVLKTIGLDIQCISLAKENEIVFIPSSDNPIAISKYQKSLQILQHIRDEAHRFGLAYNKKLRENKLHL